MTQKAGLSLPGSSYETIRTIIKGYFAAGAHEEDMGLDEIARSTALRKPEISRNNKFLDSLGIITKVGYAYRLTSEGKDLALALQYEDKQAASKVWRLLVIDNDILRGIVSAVRVSGEMSEEKLLQHIGMALEVPKNNRKSIGLRTIVSMMVDGEILEDHGGNFRVTEGYIQTSGERVKTEAGELRSQRGWAEVATGEGAEPIIPVTINVNIATNIDDMASEESLVALAETVRRLRDLLQGNQEET